MVQFSRSVSIDGSKVPRESRTLDTTGHADWAQRKGSPQPVPRRTWVGSERRWKPAPVTLRPRQTMIKRSDYLPRSHLSVRHFRYARRHCLLRSRAWWWTTRLTLTGSGISSWGYEGYRRTSPSQHLVLISYLYRNTVHRCICCRGQLSLYSQLPVRRVCP